MPDNKKSTNEISLKELLSGTMKGPVKNARIKTEGFEPIQEITKIFGDDVKVNHLFSDKEN